MKLSFGLIVLAYIFSAASAKTFLSDKDVTTQMIKYAKKTQTNDEAIDFKKLLKIISFPAYVFRESIFNYNQPRVSILCVTCRSTVSTILNLHEGGASNERILNVLIDLCTTLKLQPEHVCRGIVDLNAPILWYMLENRDSISPRSFCGVVLQSSDPSTCPFSDERYEFTVDIPEKNITEIPQTKNNGTTFKVAHISDTHYDPAYEAGALAACDEATCCRKGQTQKESRRWRSLKSDVVPTEEHVHIAEDGTIFIDIDNAHDYEPKITRESKEIPEEDRAGYWGDYRNCDSPWWAFEDGVDHVVENNDVDYVYFTGDVIDHGVWETSVEMITNSLNDTFIKLKKAFGNTPLFPIIGNHESQPLNQYAPPSVTDPEVSTAWLYNLLVDLWSDWLPSSTKETILKGGYYTVLVKPGFRIIALNTNLCYIFNWWLHLEPKDPSGQFAWLVDTLLEAEKAGEKVHILSHIPTGTGSPFYICSREYARIVRRFADTIVAEFNGHSHNDEFKIYYKNGTSDPFAVAWNGGSLTTYSFVNPNYRIYEVNSDTYDIVDGHTWIYNLTEANLTPEKRPRWFKEYSFKEHYGLESLNPSEMDNLVNKMVTTDKNLLLDYNIFRGKSYEKFYTCDNTCLKNNLCYMVKAELHDTTKCDDLWQVYNDTRSI